MMEHFIESVRKYPCLWNSTAIEYRDQELKDAAWAEVMKETDLSSVKEVKLKWKKLRDSYRDALKRQSELLAKEPAATQKKPYPWKYMMHMQFLQPHMSARKRLSTHDEAAASTNGVGRSLLPQTRSSRSPSRSRSPRSDSSDSESDGPPPATRRRTLDLIDRKLEYLCRRAAAPPTTQPPPPPAAPSLPTTHTSTTGSASSSPPPDPLDTFFSGMCQATKRFPYHTQIKIKRAVFEAVTSAEEALLAEQQSYAALWARAASSSDSERSATGADHHDTTDGNNKPT